MNIGEAAKMSGVSAKMIRHYEAMGAIPRPKRTPAGYRRYEASDIQRLAFIRRARAAGFGASDIKKLISLWEDPRRPAREVKRIAIAHLGEIEARIEELRAIAGALSHLLEHCRGDDRPECPILESLIAKESIRTMQSALSQRGRRRPVPLVRSSNRPDPGRR